MKLFHTYYYTLLFLSWFLLYTAEVSSSTIELDNVTNSKGQVSREKLVLVRREETLSSNDVTVHSEATPASADAPTTQSPDQTTSDTAAVTTAPPPISSSPPAATITTAAEPTQKPTIPATEQQHSSPQASARPSENSYTNTSGNSNGGPSNSKSPATVIHATPSSSPSLPAQQPVTTPWSSLALSSSSIPVESALTSVNPTLVLGDMECASDQLARNGKCPADYYCNAALKQCQMQLNNGMICAADFQCASGYCIGVCDKQTQTHMGQQALSGTQIVGITLGSIGGALILATSLLLCYRRRKRKESAEKSRALQFMMDGDAASTKQMSGNSGTRLSKYNFLTQMLDGQQQQKRNEKGNQVADSDSILDYRNGLHHNSINDSQQNFTTSSTSTTALRPRPVTEDFQVSSSLSILPRRSSTLYEENSRSRPRPDSEALPLGGFEDYDKRNQLVNEVPSSDYLHSYRDSMTDATYTSQLAPTPPRNHYTEQQQQHFLDINHLWDDALHRNEPHRGQDARLVYSSSHDAWSQEDQASFPTTRPRDSIYTDHTSLYSGQTFKNVTTPHFF